MKRLNIVVEGQTEQSFVNEVLTPYLQSKGVAIITPILIHTSKTGRGGFVNYHHLHNTVKGLLKNPYDGNIVVSSFVDFFRMPNNMPDYDDAMRLGTDLQKVESLQQALGNSIADRRFIPYIQLHEFEALLFSNNNGFEYLWEDDMSSKTKNIVDSFENPEDINSAPETAPSKRLLAINQKYDKVLEGNVIALEVGINEMLAKCPRFADWVSRLITACSE
ncbi:MAG: DUF4276 family protein [Bacteroidales bacterium]|nr:DUF4276 family protein [Bacteroidales bacterium]